ncbi:MAG: arginine repressor [Proteobacteria bacterium]|nr:MAG: arginine repressor [Pseudomonadota bacterium]
MLKTRRHALLLQLIESGQIDSQQCAARLLAKHGFKTTQATVSRDLDELGAVRVRVGDDMRYAIPSQSSQFGAALPQVMREFVISRQTSGNMIVLHTPPGHANMVAAAIDRDKIDGVLGVVAGDDTLFVCVDERLGAKKVLSMLEERGSGE